MQSAGSTEWSEQLRDCARRFAAGETVALGQLFDLVAPRLLRYAQTLLRCRDDAEDAVQAAIVRVARRPAVLVTADHPWAYLLKVVRNETYRVMARGRPRVSPHTETGACPSAEVLLCHQEQQAEIQAALRRLPAEQVEVVVLKIWEGLTFQEIAVVTGESLNTVASRYRYALKKLETTLRRLAGDVGYVV